MTGRERLFVAKPGKDPHAFVQTDEDTTYPMDLLGNGAIAFQIGKITDRSSWMLAIASLSDGRIVRRLEATKGLEITSLASSPDGKTLYYSAAGNIWAISAESGQGRKQTAGDNVAMDPNGRDLIIWRTDKDAVRMVRVSLTGAAEQPIPIPSALRLSGHLASNAVNKDGRILLDVDALDSCWERPAIFDPRTGKMERVNVPYSGDVWQPVWTPDGHILALGAQVRAALWRFRREKK